MLPLVFLVTEDCWSLLSERLLSGSFSTLSWTHSSIVSMWMIFTLNFFACSNTLPEPAHLVAWDAPNILCALVSCQKEHKLYRKTVIIEHRKEKIDSMKQQIDKSKAESPRSYRFNLIQWARRVGGLRSRGLDRHAERRWRSRTRLTIFTPTAGLVILRSTLVGDHAFYFPWEACFNFLKLK